MDKISRKSEKIHGVSLQRAEDDCVRMRQAFHQSLDFSYIESWVKELLQLTPQELFSKSHASGSHYACYLLRRPGFPMDLAVKIPMTALGQKGSTNAPKFMHALKRIAFPNLIPPFHELTLGGSSVLVMPFADQPVTAAAAHWQPIHVWVDLLHAKLSMQGLILDDVVQMRCWKGIPLVIDFSDLKQSF